MAKRNRCSIVEHLESRRLMSASLSLGGTQTISPTPPQALDQTAPLGGSQAESMTAVDPTNPLNIATVVANNGFTVLDYYSHDGGKTWNWNTITDGAGDDPCVAFDANGNLFVTYLNDLNGGPDVLESTDKGVTFGADILLTGQFGDKEMIATGVDPTTGRQALYVVYVNYAINREQAIGIREDSSGQLDRTSIVTESLPKETIDGVQYSGDWGHPLVGSAGQLYVPLWYGEPEVAFTRDLDGLWGETDSFSAPQIIYESPVQLPVRYRVPASPNLGVSVGIVAAIDQTNGALYVTWDEPRSAAFYSSSQDPTCSVVVSSCTNPDSASPVWSSPVAVDPIGSSTECTEFLPWISVDPSSGGVFVSYLTTDGNSTGDLADVRPRLAWSTDGGASWSKQNLTDLTSNASYDGTHYEYLEYMGLAVVDGTVHAAFTRVTTTSDDLYGVNAAVISSDGANVLSINGTSSTDDTIVQRDPFNTDYLDVVINGATAYSGLFASIDRVSVLGGNADDALSIDAFNGTAVPWEGLSYDGGSGNNSISLLGTGARDAISVATGQIAATGSFGSEVMTVSNIGAITYTPGIGDHALTVNGSVPVTIPRSTGTGIRELDLSNLSIGSGATVVFASSSVLGDYSSHANRSVVIVAAGGLNIAAGGTLDLGDNDMILDYDPANEAAAKSLISGLVASGYGANKDFSGTGIDSSEAYYDATQSGGTRAIGWGDNADLGKTSFDGVALPTVNEMLIKFTYYGDSNLDGIVDTGGDLALYSKGLHGLGSGWDFGDFNYDGATNNPDLSLFARGLDNGYDLYGAL